MRTNECLCQMGLQGTPWMVSGVLTITSIKDFQNTSSLCLSQKSRKWCELSWSCFSPRLSVTAAACRQMGAPLISFACPDFKWDCVEWDLSAPEAEPTWLALMRYWVPVTILGGSGACKWHCCPGVCNWALVKAAMGTFVQIRPCVWQAVVNHAVTEGQPICSPQSSHYPCLWTVSKCRRLLAASPCPRCLHNQIFPQQKKGLVTGRSRCVICRKEHDWTVVFSA